MYKLYGLEFNYFNKFLDFQQDIQKLKSISSPELIEKVKLETSERIDDNGKKIYSIIDNDAHIEIQGQLRESPEICATLFGEKQTLYKNIINAINMANNDNEIQKIILNIDSPGGTVNGVDITAMAIRNSTKFIEAKIHNLGASAAYWLASQADKITAMSPTVEIGSIGVVAEVIDSSESDKTRGIKKYSLTSTDAPEKRPDITKKSGRDIIINRLDNIHNVFVSRISEGRKISIDEINKNFGKGNILIAEKALSVGMIDEIQNSVNDINSEKKIIKEKTPQFVEGKNNKGVNLMNLNELKTNHLDLYNQIKTEVLDFEKKRVNALLGWDQNEEVRKISRQAIIEGKSQNDILAQLMNSSNIKEKIDNSTVENVPDINNAKSVNDDIITDDVVSILPSKSEILTQVGGV